MTRLERSYASVEELDRNELESFREMRPQEFGVLAALDYCLRNAVTPPEWAIRSAIVSIANGLCGRHPKGIGRFGGFVHEYHRLHIHFIRHDAVCEVREKQRELARTVAELQSMRNVPTKLLKEKQKMLKFVGRTLEDAYECAAILLTSGKPSSIQRSYFEWQKICEDQNQLNHYRLLSPRVLRLLGIYDVPDPQPVSELLPLIDLTL